LRAGREEGGGGGERRKKTRRIRSIRWEADRGADEWGPLVGGRGCPMSTRAGLV